MMSTIPLHDSSMFTRPDEARLEDKCCDGNVISLEDKRREKEDTYDNHDLKPVHQVILTILMPLKFGVKWQH